MAHPRYGQYCNEVSKERLTACKCPRCGISHKARIFWTGNGTPRVFCKTCSHIAKHPDFAEAGHYVAGLTIQGRTGFVGIKI